MDFTTSDEQMEITDLAERIFADRVDAERLRKLEESGETLDSELWAELARANLLGTALPEEVGGMAFGLFELGALLETQGRHLARVPLTASLAWAGLPIAEFGTDAQRQRHLAPLAAGDGVLTAALEEMGGGDPTQPATRAVRSGNTWALHGEKVCVPAADVASAVLLPAAVDDANVGVFLLNPRSPGVSLERQIGTHGEPAFTLTLDGAAVENDEMLGAPGQGHEVVAWTRDRAMVALGWLQLGVSAEALRRTAEYASTRKQFGRPIGSFQTVGARAADGYIDLEALRSVLLQATWILAEGLPAASAVRVARWWACRVAHRVGHTAQHLHGGIGADVEYPIHRYFLWSKHLSLSLGGESQQLAEIGASLVGRS